MIDILALSSLNFVQGVGGSRHTQVKWKPNVILASHDGQAITDGRGRNLEVDSALSSIEHCDAVLVPGFLPDGQGHPPKSLTNSMTQSWLVSQYQKGALLCGSCSGVFALGEAGLLNNRKCTTTWWLHDELKQRFPKSEAAWASELIEDKRIVSAGGPLSWVTIALHVIKKLAGIEIANIVADFSVVDAIPRSQDLYIPEGYQVSKNPFLIKAEYAIRKAHYQNISVSDLAKRMAVSERTLNRKLKQLTGAPPKSFIDRTRISHACTLLSTTNQPVNEIAFSLGYSDDNVFRRLFKKTIKTTPSSYRKAKKLLVTSSHSGKHDRIEK